MQFAKKYFTDGLIQLTILLSLIGVRVDIDSYLNGYYSPLIEINLGPSSAYTQTPFHSLRDTLDGYSVHPKCPELDYFFASRRLLDEVRSLGSPRFPSPQLNAWLVHQVTAPDKAECGQPSQNSGTEDSTSTELQDGQQEGVNGREHLPDCGQEGDGAVGAGPCTTGACAVPKEIHNDELKIKEEDEPVSLTHLAHSSTLEQESLLGGVGALSHPSGFLGPSADTDQSWSQLLHLSVSDLEDLDSLVNARLPELDTDLSSALQADMCLEDITLQDTIMSPPTAPQHTDPSSPGLAPGLAALPFASVCNFTGGSSQGLGDGLDEAVFEQINQLGLEGLETMDQQLLSCLDPQLLEDFDSDSGLSLESSSGGPLSPGSSEMSSSSSSLCEEECGATGYSSEVDSKSLLEHRPWSPIDLSESVWHDHSYSSPLPITYPHKGIKEEPLSEEEEYGLEERELSRDEVRARAMCLPFSVLQIVNMPVEEFLEVLDSHGFSSEQVTLLRDIRRRGKNKLAAQNCRKRKLDAITGLQEEVSRLQAQRERLLRDKRLTAKTMCAVGQQIQQLTRDVLSRLRDPLGQPLTPDRYSLQCGANGKVVLVPARRPTVSGATGNKTDKRKKAKKQ
ncbi:nuclear factor erythroid 2-related factor 3 [Periophthalmus magnuspinnatus]|uniref:nuclear factor erythroid 2-related factor 3 n=1 Tax=Periophthalmus magnuspinnatus TaxID=409849 RepID=UPI00145B6418|nr:nuclear factor erythroid 2-related factor 3 [Periophthalmus magnuspinnatus]